MIRRFNLLMVSGLALAGAATTALAQTAPAVAPAPSAAPAPMAPPADGVMTAEDVQAGKIGTVPPGKALIVFFRPSGLGGALGFTVHEGDANISKIGAGSYQLFLAEPGTHAYAIKSEATDTLRLELDPGEVYYVKEYITMGIVVGRPHLVLSDKATFDKVSAGLRVSKWTDPAAGKPATPAKSGQ